MRDAAVVVADLQATLADVRVAATGVRQLIETSGPDLATASERIRAISENLAKTTANLDRLMTDHREDLGLFLRDSLPEIERLLRDSRSAAQEFRELSRSLKADPSQLLYEPSYRAWRFRDDANSGDLPGRAHAHRVQWSIRKHG